MNIGLEFNHSLQSFQKKKKKKISIENYFPKLSMVMFDRYQYFIGNDELLKWP